jgi:hypothetical protein
MPAFAEREGVHVTRMAAAVLDVDGMVRRRRVEVLARDEAPLRGLGVVVLEADHPFARRRLRGALAYRILDRPDGAQVAVDHSQVHATGRGGMAMPVDEARRDGLSTEVDDCRAAAGERAHLGVGADRQDVLARNRDGLGARLSRVHREDDPVLEHEVRPFLGQRSERAAVNEWNGGQRGRRASAIRAD